VAALLGALTFNNYFTALRLDDCAHMDEPLVAKHLAQLARHNPCIATLSLDRAQLSRETLIEFAEALEVRYIHKETDY
jgi:hypothetical protein